MMAFDEQHDSWVGIIEVAFGMQELTHDEMLDAFDTSLSVKTMILIYAVGLGAIALSTIIPIAYLLKLEPKKVLL